jgi:hypothetical protein
LAHIAFLQKEYRVAWYDERVAGYAVRVTGCLLRNFRIPHACRAIVPCFWDDGGSDFHRLISAHPKKGVEIGNQLFFAVHGKHGDIVELGRILYMVD